MCGWVGLEIFMEANLQTNPKKYNKMPNNNKNLMFSF